MFWTKNDVNMEYKVLRKGLIEDFRGMRFQLEID